MFSIKLTPQADNTYAGYILYATDEAGDFQVVTSAGELTIQTVAEGSEVEIEKILAVECEPAAQGHIVELEKDEQYILGLTGFSSDEALLLIGPAAGHHHHEGDPHFWLDPRLVVKYVENIRDGLVAADPAGKDVYTKNAADYIVRLNELDDWIKTQVEQIPVENRLFVTNHESFGYFADRYGFQIIGTVIPSTSPETAPSAQHLSRLINRIKETGAKAIFLETGASPQLADQVAAEPGVKVVTELYTHSITDQNGKAPSYIEMMKINVQEIVDALK
jgi:ABC-type Zn uptake system ZnuABC Zn-binding protein ZnuA